MQLRNIHPFSQYKPGDVVDVPDGAAFDEFHWEPVAPPPPPAAPVTPVAAVPQPAATPKEM